MTKPTATRMALIGCGSMARHHVRNMLAHSKTTDLVVVCEPSPAAYAAMAKVFEEKGHKPPPNVTNLEKLLRSYADQLDAVFIITPHVFHHNQAKACMEAGLDVLLEKPMVMNAGEALSLIETRDRTGRVLVVAFQSSLSPFVRLAVSMLGSGELGPILNISGLFWQNWTDFTRNTWRQQPELAGGGFLFDSGAHLLNSVVDLAGEDFAEVAAWFDHQGQPVEILAAVMGRLKSGTLVTLNVCGATVPSCASDIRVFCSKAMIRTGAWGEFLEIQRNDQDGWEKVTLPPSRGVWEQFLAVRRGDTPNPCPPEVGLRLAYLWDAIKASAAQNGMPVRIDYIGREN